MSFDSQPARPAHSLPTAGTTLIAWGLLTIGGLVFLVDAWRYSDFLIDDTFISLRYARNWIQGHGLVFNREEYVEGYTNFSFVALSALFLRIGIDPIVGMKAVSVLMSLLILVVLARMEGLVRSIRFSLRQPPIALLLLLPVEAFAYWAIASFETMLFAGLLLLGLYQLMQESMRAGGHRSAFFFVLLALTRPEGLALFLVCNLSFALVDVLRRRSLAMMRRYAVNGALFAAGFLPYFICRWWYYGRPLPNTFYAKVTGGLEQIRTGLTHGGEALLAFPLFCFALILTPILLVRRRSPLDPGTAFIAAIYLVVLAHVSYVILIGGDFMPFFRFLLPMMPLCALLLAWSLPQPARVSLMLAVLITLVASHLTEQSYRAFVAHRTTVVGLQTGKWLAEHLEPSDVIAVNTAGAIPYASGLPTIDMLGLTDPNIAARPVFIVSTGWAGHRKGWGDYVLAQKPRVILWYNTAGSREPFYLGDHELADSPLFRFFYRAKATVLPNPTPDEDPLERFLGNPFEVSSLGKAVSPDLGIQAVLTQHPLRHTVLHGRDITMNYFELDDRDRALWPTDAISARGIDSLVDSAVRIWQADPHRTKADRKSTVEVETLCERARQRAEAGDYAAAQQLLSIAARRDATVHSPLVYQYIANVAVMSGDLFTAVGAQKDALRLAPENRLYQNNLRRLLSEPYKEFREQHEE